jgi:hypothetical protein
VYIVHNIGLNNKNYYSWMREIHIVKTMGIIINTKKTIDKSLGKPQNLFSFEVR